jgi:methionine biosynthesis protein MetW
MSIRSGLYKWLRNQALKSEDECRRAELSLLERNIKAKILDLGCGDGTFTEKIMSKIGIKEAFAIEIIEDDIKKATSRGIKVFKENLNERLPFDNGTFDVIIASHVIEHLNDTDIFLKEVYRNLKDDGYLIIATPNLAAWLHIFFLILGKQPTIAEVSDYALVGTWSPRKGNIDRAGPAHRRIFTLGALKGLLEIYGLKVDKANGTGYFPLSGFLSKIMAHLDKFHSTNMAIKARKIKPNLGQ